MNDGDYPVAFLHLYSVGTQLVNSAMQHGCVLQFHLMYEEALSYAWTKAHFLGDTTFSQVEKSQK